MISNDSMVRLKKLIRRLLTGGILVGLLWLLYILAGRALCYIAIRQIGELTNTSIRTESVDYHANGSIFIKRFVVCPCEVQDDEDAIFKAEAVYARFSIGSLFLLRPRLKVISVSNFVFNAQYDLDTGWSNLSGLKFKLANGGSGKMPRVHLKAGKLQYSKISKGQTTLAVSMPINADFLFDEETEKGYGFKITTDTMASGFGKSHLTGFWKPGSVTIAGGISSADIPELEMAWTIDVLAAEFKYYQDDAFSLMLRVTDLQSKRSPVLSRLALVGPAFLKKSSPFAALEKFFDRYGPYGQVDIELDASGNLNQIDKSTLVGKVYCKDVGLCYYNFQYAIEHLTGRIDFTRNSLTLNNLNGKHGDVELFFNGWSGGFGPDWKYEIRITSNKMPLDNDLYSALSSGQKEFWSAFSPTGFAAVDYRLTRQSQSDKNKQLAVELQGAQAIYRHFPYPLKNLFGRISFNRNVVIFSDLVSQADEQEITLNGELKTGSDEGTEYDISIEVNNISLDSTLEAALPDSQKNLYRQFSPSGLADGWIRISKRNSGPAGYTADLSFEKASLRSDQFPLPVYDVLAKAVFTPDLILIKEFEGRYDHSQVSMTGQIRPGEKREQSRYSLSLNFKDAQLDDDLLGLLPESLKEIIFKLNPTGKVNINADLDKETLNETPDYSITVECLGNRVTLSQFPYPLKDVTGTLTINENNIKLEDITATLDNGAPAEAETAKLKLNGDLNLAGNTFNSALLQLQANDIFFDERLGLILPQHIQPLYGKISPTGRFDLDFEQVRISREDDGATSVDFGGDIKIKDSSFRISGGRNELNAVLKTKGLFRTGEGFSSCRAVLDRGTLKVHGKSFTDLKTDIDYDPNLQVWSTEDMIADFYGGKLTGKFEIRQPNEQAFEYLLQVSFNNVDLEQFLSDTKLEKASTNGYTSGRMDGSLNINTQISDSSSRIGTCRLTISDMQVGKLSPLAKLLQVLKLTEPKNFAFNSMFIDSYIRGKSMFVEKLDLSGQTHAFNGSGRMDLESNNVDLTLTSRGRRAVAGSPSLLQSLTEGLGQAVVRMEIAGNFHDPEITTKTLPVIEETLQILGTKPATSD